MWCVPAIDGEYVERMEDVLRLYARLPDPAQPVVCLDERPVVLRGDARKGRPMRPGKPARIDYEYERKGTATIFCIVEPKTGRRLTHATAKRAGADFARALQRIAGRYRRARRIHLVVDNLSTHSLKCLIAALGPLEGHRLWRRFEKCTTRPSTGAGSMPPRWRPASSRANASVAAASRACCSSRLRSSRGTGLPIATGAQSSGSSASTMRGASSATMDSLPPGRCTRRLLTNDSDDSRTRLPFSMESLLAMASGRSPQSSRSSRLQRRCANLPMGKRRG